LLDINRIAELCYVRGDSDGVRVGALARHAEVEADTSARRVQPLLPKALQLVAHATIRNQGTVVGSLAHADAAAEIPMVLRLLGGSVTAQSVEGKRTIDAPDLFAGPIESTLRADEILTEAHFPAMGARQGVAIDEVARRHGDYALCGVAAVVGVGTTGAIESVHAGYLSVS